jgi:hypothetical protein
MTSAWLRIGFVSLLSLCAFCASGCVEREILIRSDPADARVLLDGEGMGRTPIGIPFVHYGTREVTLKKPGYKTVTTFEKIRAPWYEVFPIDFFAEVLWPGTLRDEHIFAYTLEPEKGPVDSDKLLERARSARKEATSY